MLHRNGLFTWCAAGWILGTVAAAFAQSPTPPTSAAAHYTTPVQRYGHFALGPPHEYASLVVPNGNGKALRLDLAEDEVFEDLTPRPVRMRAGDEPQWLTIVSQRGLGARIALVGVRNGQLKITAQSASIGQANRWLNPVGVVDLDGDGEAEIVAVVTPHLAGVLTVYQQQGSELVARATLRGLSNHRFGSTELGMSGFIPDAQGATVVVPNLEHQALVMVRYAHGELRETGRCPLPAPVVGAVRWAANTGLTAVLSTGLYMIKMTTCQPST
jgi:hypothetical protein